MPCFHSSPVIIILKGTDDIKGLLSEDDASAYCCVSSLLSKHFVNTNRIKLITKETDSWQEVAQAAKTPVNIGRDNSHQGIYCKCMYIFLYSSDMLFCVSPGSLSKHTWMQTLLIQSISGSWNKAIIFLSVTQILKNLRFHQTAEVIWMHKHVFNFTKCNFI